MPGPNGTDSAQVVQAVELAQQTELLHTLVEHARTDLLQIAIGDMDAQELMLSNFPVAGSKRVIARRTGNGFDTLAVPTTGVLVLPANEGRVGGQIVNSGANAVILYLWEGGTAKPGIPAIWLAPNGGSWDFRLSNIPWVGNVTAVAQTAASTLTVAEV